MICVFPLDYLLQAYASCSAIGRDVRPKIEVAYLSTKFILMDRETNIKLNGKKMTVIEFTVQKLQIFEYLIFGVFPEIIQ